MKSILTAIALSALATVAQAQQTTTALSTNFNRVCAATFVLSAKAQIACASKKMPVALKSGERFANRSAVGSEFNTLIRQLK